MAACTQSYEKVLPVDISAEFPGYACLLGNLLEAVGVALAHPACPYDMVINTFLSPLKCGLCRSLFL